ncbi:MAG: hypothetical protein NTW21_41300 [Verrucomicrobia bacterium]|nr:hypothetical protein [Verrucomicrobiota bacterium]
MPVTIHIPERLFERIQKQAIPFVDLTPAAVIERWADHYDASIDLPIIPQERPPVLTTAIVEGKRFNPMNPPELFHTRVVGQIAGREFNKWNDLVRLAHLLAFDRAGSLEGIQRISRANVRVGKGSGQDGFHFIPAINASIQGLDANKAWECALHLAKYSEVPLIAKFAWRDNPKAAFPGESGVLEWTPSNSAT